MRGRRRALIAVCAPVALAIACSTFSSTSDDGSPVDAGADIAAPPPPPLPPPPSPSDAAADATADAGVNLLPNGDFEIGCQGWALDGTGGSLQSDTTARTGAQSCRVCRGAIDGGFNFYANVDMDIPAATYIFEAWARRTPDDAGRPPPAELFGRAFVLDSDGTPIVGSVQTQGPPITDTWDKAGALVTYDGGGDGGGKRIEVVLGLQDGEGNCWLVDDARLYPK